MEKELSLGEIMLTPGEELRSFQQNVNENATYPGQRNQSVGYNLQQEFEALKADLDLDLSYSNTPESRTQKPVNYGLMNGLGNFQDRAMSPSASLLGQSSGFAPLGLIPNRPQSVNEYPALRNVRPNFYLELMLFTTWMENLSPQETVSMLDYWCSHLPFDILLTMKSKMQAHLQGNLQGVMQGQNVQSVNAQGQNLQSVQSQNVQGMNLNLGLNLTQSMNLSLNLNLNPGLSLNLNLAQNLAQSYKPYDKVYPDFDMELLSLDDTLRPHLAQPKPKTNNFRSHLFESKVQRPKLADPTLANRFQTERRSPTSHLYEKTNFLQLAAASNLPLSYDNIDMSATNKLGALATINSRVALDSRKNPRYEESFRQANSSSVPAQKNHAVSPKPSTPLNSSMPPEIASPDLLANIPAWLKLLRLHKYTDCLKDIFWEELVDLSDEELEARGVKALGARRKLLKAFEAVKASKA